MNGKSLQGMWQQLPGKSLRWKIYLAGMLVILTFTVIIYASIIPYLALEKLAERQGKLRAVVQSAVSMMDFYEKAVRKQGWAPDPSMPKTVEEAKGIIIKNLREMRYDKTECLFILDGDGKMIMHPLKPELEGRNMLDVADPTGRKLFQEMVVNAQRDGDAFVQYIWQSKYSPIIFEPQMTYAKYDWSWDWVICSSLYTQDIVDAMTAIKLRSALYVALTAAAAMLILITLIHLSLSQPLKKLLSGIREIHEGNLDYRIPPASRDEIGYISQAFNGMVDGLKESRDSIVRSEAKYRDLTNLLPDIIYEADAQFRFTYLNQAGYRLTGYTQADLDQGLYIKDLVDPEDYARLSVRLKDQDNPRIFAMHKIRKKEHGFFFGENSTVAVFRDGKLAALMGSIRDVTEKLKLEDQLLQTQKMESIGTLAGGLAHDFNNILNQIVCTISLMKFELNEEQQVDPEAINGNLDLMERASRRAADMVKQLLTLSRKHDTEFSSIDLGATLRNVKKMCESTFDKSIELVFDLPAGRFMAYADPTQMEQVFLNLCINASHAMTLMRPKGETGGGRLVVTIEKIHADADFRLSHPEAREIDYWRISVGDTGIGMDQSTIAKIFLPFFTTKDKGTGTGLGLSMVYSLVHQHEGLISVYSEVGVGSTFSVYIPVIQETETIGTEKVARRLPKGEGLILVIEDEEVIRQLAESVLKKCGYRTLTAPDGVEGVNVFRERHGEIKGVLLDLVMPRKSGEQAYQELKEIDPEVKVILTSGFKQDERVEATLKQGIHAFIQKPYTLEKLAEVMAEVFGER